MVCVLTSVPHLRIRRPHVHGVAMYCRDLFVHCPSSLGSAAAVPSAEVQCRDGVFATLACERSHAIHHFDAVMSHRFKSSPLSGYDSEPKLLKLECANNPVAGVASRSILGQYFILCRYVNVFYFDPQACWISADIANRKLTITHHHLTSSLLENVITKTLHKQRIAHPTRQV
jgi:hypothetical protein